MLRLLVVSLVVAFGLSTDPCERVPVLEVALNEYKNALDANLEQLRSREESTGKLLQQVMLMKTLINELYMRDWVVYNGAIPFPDPEEKEVVRTRLVQALESDEVENELPRIGNEAAKELGYPTLVSILTQIKKETESKVDSIHQEIDSMRDMSLFDVVEISRKNFKDAVLACKEKIQADAEPLYTEIETAEASIAAFEGRGQQLSDIIADVTQPYIDNDYPGAYMEYPLGTFGYQMQMFFMSELTDVDWADWVCQHIAFSIMRFPSDGISVQSIVDAMWNDFADVQHSILAPWAEELARLQAEESEIGKRIASLEEKLVTA